MKRESNQSGPTGRPPFLEWQDVSVVRGDRTVLSGLSVTIPDGEHLAVLGPNGSGKSTFIKTVVREYYPVAGESAPVFRMWGREQWNVWEVRTLLGVVSNDLQYAFTRDFTGMEVVLSGFFSSIGLFRHEVTPAMRERADEVLAFLDLVHVKDRRMTAVSSGEARRLLIGRALVNRPKVLILDEPTNSLDLHALHAFRETLRKVARAGTGIILVTHTIPDIIPEITRVIMMKDGRFWKDGPKEEVLADGNIGALFGVHVRIRQDDGYYYATGY